MLYHSVFSLVTFSASNVATCIAPCCPRLRGRRGHVRVARDRLGPDAFNSIKFGTAPAAVKARADARRPPRVVRDHMISNEEEDEGLEKLASDTVRAPQDSATINLSARTTRNLLPCSGEISQGEVWNRTADWRTACNPRAAISAADQEQHMKTVALILSSSLGAGIGVAVGAYAVTECVGTGVTGVAWVHASPVGADMPSAASLALATTV